MVMCECMYTRPLAKREVKIEMERDRCFVVEFPTKCW